jgi:hypothetical protein
MERDKTNEGRNNFPHGFFAERVGRSVTVRDCPFGYSLPAGLNPGDRVKVVSFDHSCYTVDKNGDQFEIFLTNVVEEPSRRRLW